MMNLASVAGFDAVVLYDMPGLDFFADGEKPGYVAPEPAVKAGFEAMLTAGVGVVALHHAIAGWPTWPQYADWLGGRFLYKPGEVRGAVRADSGYRHDVEYTARAVDPTHPILAGVPAAFAMKDELYLSEVFEDDVTPLLTADYAFTQDAFYSAHHAVARAKLFSNDGWAHASGSNLIGWTKTAINSRLVYLQPGDGPETYDNPHYRRLIRNAIGWVAGKG
jgi:type 1 glutamine amidotransferase